MEEENIQGRIWVVGFESSEGIFIKPYRKEVKNGKTKRNQQRR